MKTLQSVQDFETLKNDGVHVFLFTANWCGDCRFLEPSLPEIEEAFPNYEFVSVDRDQFIDLCIDLNIFGIPSFIVFKDGEEVGRFVSKDRKTKEEVIDFISGLSI